MKRLFDSGGNEDKTSDKVLGGRGGGNAEIVVMEIIVAIIAVTGTIAGAAVVGTFAYFANKQRHHHEMQKFQTELLLSKYEAIYTNLSEHINLAAEVSIHLFGDAGFGAKLDPEKITTKTRDDNLHMNILFYAPQLLPYHKSINAERNALGKHMAEFVLKPSESGKDRKLLIATDAYATAKKIGSIAKSAQEVLSELVRQKININGNPVP